MKKLYLVDASNMFFRAFFAIPPMKTKTGQPTNALYGFLSMSVRLLREQKPDFMAYCFDRKEPSFRNDMYPEYKTNREQMPEDLVPQLPYLKKIAELLGIPCLDLPGYEADDVIGTLAEYGRKKELDVVIVSGDKDFAQLIRPGISMLDTMKNVKYDTDGVREKWGVEPSQFIDYLALVGDSSDNVPGVKGIGPKGAQKLLSQYQNLDGIYQSLEQVSGKSIKSKLQEQKNEAYLSQKLVTIVTDAPVDLNEETLSIKELQKEKLIDLFNELEFKSFEKKLFSQKVDIAKESENGKNKEKVKKTPSSTGDLSKSSVEIFEWNKESFKKEIPPYSEVWAISNERGFYLKYKNKIIKPVDELFAVGEILQSKFLKWQGFDLKSIWRDLSVIPQIAHTDLMISGYLVLSKQINSFEQLYLDVLGQGLPDLMEIKDIFFAYAELLDALAIEIKEKNLEKVLNQIELPLVPVLYQMEQIGVYVDTTVLNGQSQQLEVEIKNTERDIFKSTGKEFNIASPKQLGKILFEDLKLPIVKKTKTGFSTGSDVLQKLSPQHPACEMILQYRELTKLKSTYVDSLPALVNPKTHRIHSHFKQAVTTTGRLSSVNPNLQNIPIRTERGRAIRSAFIAGEGKMFLSVDYSQIELRLLAHITNDSGLINAFKNDIDVHAATASEIYGVPLTEVTGDLRRRAKAVNFGIAYGQGAYGLAESLGVSRAEGKEIIEKYFLKFPGVKEYMLQTIEKGKADGFVESIFGRRRYIEEFKSKSPAIVKFGERAAINAPMQGSASDLIKMAMLRVFEEVESPLVLQVHDELVLECDVDIIQEESVRVRDIMENVASLRVPLKVNIATGKNWLEAHA